MSRFIDKVTKSTPGISTASLPDIVFMLLFFFMVTTVMREVTLLVKNNKPFATEVKKLERRSLVAHIYVGQPRDIYQEKLGPEPRIQLEDAFARLDEVQDFIIRTRDDIPEAERPLMTVSIKSDENAKMGLITDVKQELRQAEALKINYSTRKGDIYSF